ncbi:MULTISPECIES: hypothetical protein [unclassified Enterococcus]|uniref:hypothetical protein n=1 Tax=unclassified Enterococcus TaxID=2608891 RepID=UPI0015574C5F|nr:MULTISPECIES: hypothetical protein [unclassified Enterococcus]MBS7576101.1 hypothetical protein [Enterococcus sp. MMGLQ5-2]MBS7583334.1 hypothetical protein [Enterococcus sp. MMGLQ5-1]NPD11194.1 hypothetical protein [Enterococcus sp. MMGLQ5-1]NPD35937.1 hypothetical protein [Enterococcus sp. MMGLQ5-2]
MMEEHFYIKINGDNKDIKINDALKQELFNAYKSEKIFQDDFFVIPIINFTMELTDDIESCYFGKRFIPCTILTRSLLDATMSLIYFLQVPNYDYHSFFEEYLKTGELTKAPNKNGKRWRVTGKELCKIFKSKVKYDVSESYQNLSRYVHPTIKHFYSIYQDLENEKFELTVYGSNTKFNNEQYLELRQLIYSCIDVLILVLNQRGGIF